MAMTTASLMTNSVISVAPEASLLDVLRLFVEENIHGAPVVDEDGQLQGVVTTSDLLRAQAEEHDSVATTSDYFRGMLEFSAPDWEGDLTDFQGRLANRTVSDVMTKQVLSVSLDTPVSEVARCLREHQVHRVWIEDAGRLCGVVSALDLMPVIEGASATK